MLIVSRDEIYLNAILTGDTSNLPTPISRVDRYLYQIAMNGTGGGGSIKLDENFDYSAHSSAPSTAFFTEQNAIVTQRITGNADKITSLEETVTNNLSSVWSEISKINNTLENLPTGDVTITTLFDNSNYSNYLNWKMLVDQWGDTEYTLQQAIERVPSICSEEYSNQLRLSSAIGWSANAQLMSLTPVELKQSSILKVNYTCSTTGSDITVDVLSSADFTAEPIATFENIPSVYVENNTYLLINLSPSTLETGIYYLKFSYNTINPVFLIKSIKIAT